MRTDIEQQTPAGVSPVYEIPATVVDDGAEMTVEELRAYLNDWIATEPELRYVNHQSLRKIAEGLSQDKSLADIAMITGIPVEVTNGDGSTRKILRDELTRFGTWLGQRDAELRKVPASNFTVTPDLAGCLNAKRNVVVSHNNGKLRPDVLADFLNQRYASGDVNMTRAAFAGAATTIAYSPTGVGWFLANIEADRAGEGAQPAVLMLKILDLAETVREDLANAAKNIRSALGPANPPKLNEALQFASWVDPAKVRDIMALQARIKNGNRAAATAMIREVQSFVERIEALSDGDELEFIQKLSHTGMEEASLITALLDRYMPEERNSRRHLEAEARAWLRERGMGRQAGLLLSHVMWALTNDETDLLEVCMAQRSRGDADWEEPLLEAQTS